MLFKRHQQWQECLEIMLAAAGPRISIDLKPQNYVSELLITQEPQGSLDLSALVWYSNSGSKWLHPCLCVLTQEIDRTKQPVFPLPQLLHDSSTSLGPEPLSHSISGSLLLRPTTHSAFAVRFLLPSLLWSWFLFAACHVSGGVLVFITSCYGWR